MVRPYGFMAKFLHWAFIVVFVYGVINQVDEVEELQSSSLLIQEIFHFDIPVSVVVLIHIYAFCKGCQTSPRYA